MDGQTLFTEVARVYGRFSLLEVSTSSSPFLPRHLTLPLGEVGTIRTLELPACRQGPGTAQTHGSD